jgi:hypothetical protein
MMSGGDFYRVQDVSRLSGAASEGDLDDDESGSEFSTEAWIRQTEI